VKVTVREACDGDGTRRRGVFRLHNCGPRIQNRATL
jgi:hypothetical protein